MNVTGKITMFVENKEGQKGKYNIYVGSISHKHQDNTYTNARIEMEFDNNFPAKDKLSLLKSGIAYTLDIKEGWLDSKCWEYEGKKQYRILIHIKDATILDSKEIVKSNGKLPF